MNRRENGEGKDMTKSIMTIPIRVTPEELAYIKECAEASGAAKFKNGRMNLSRYLREQVLRNTGYEDVELARQLRDLQYELRKIGTNVNQIARKINSGFIGSSEDLAELKGYLRQIGEFSGVLMELLGSRALTGNGTHS